MEEMDPEIVALFHRVHAGLPRQAPGSAATSALLLRLAGNLPESPRVLDIGCGPGSASILLAELTGGTVVGVDTHRPFLDELLERAEAAGVADRVSALEAPMEALPTEAGTFDLIWAEGSAYIMGFDAALAAWRPFLSPGGVLVLTEAEYTTPNPAAGTKAFWEPGYPAMRTTAANVAASQEAGWEVRATYLLPDSDWAEYYDPITERAATLRAEGVDAEVLDMVTEEIGIRERHGNDYGYTGYVLAPR